MLIISIILFQVFLEKYTEGMLILAAMEFLGIDSLDGTPRCNARNDDEDEAVYTKRIMTKFVDEYLILPDIAGREVLHCPKCNRVYKDRQALRKHLEKDHTGNDGANGPPVDGVRNYSCQVLSMCMIAHDFTNARKLGDGDRIIRLIKYMLLYFKSLKKPKYAYQCLRLLAQVKCFLTPREAANVIWNRFSNTKGCKDSNCEHDRECEHSNLNFKICGRRLHGQVNQNTVDRISRSCQPITEALYHVDMECGTHKFSRTQHVDQSDDVRKLIEQLKPENLFSFQGSRYHKCFPGFTGGFKVDHDDMFVWMTTSLGNLGRKHQFSFDRT